MNSASKFRRFHPSRRVRFAFVFVAVCLVALAFVRLRPLLATRDLRAAIERNNLDAVKSAIQHGADVNARFASSDASAIRVEDILKALTGWDNGVYRTTPLIYAVEGKHSKIAQLLVEQGADVNAKIVGGETALLRAAHSGDVKLVSVLLAHGANPNAHWKDGTTALRAAWRSPEIISMLKKAGARK